MKTIEYIYEGKDYTLKTGSFKKLYDFLRVHTISPNDKIFIFSEDKSHEIYLGRDDYEDDLDMVAKEILSVSFYFILGIEGIVINKFFKGRERNIYEIEADIPVGYDTTYHLYTEDVEEPLRDTNEVMLPVYIWFRYLTGTKTIINPAEV